VIATPWSFNIQRKWPIEVDLPNFKISKLGDLLTPNIENGPFTVDLPIKNGDFPVRKLETLRVLCEAGVPGLMLQYLMDGTHGSPGKAAKSLRFIWKLDDR